MVAAATALCGQSEEWSAGLRREVSKGISDGAALIRSTAQNSKGGALERRKANESSQDNPLAAAAYAYLRLGAPVEGDVLTLVSERDEDDRFLTGAERYRIRFLPANLPPARAFWRLTTSPPATARFRREIGDRSDLAVHADGSLDIFIQTSPPEEPKLSNWLPCPEGVFNLVLRLYAPDQAALRRWRMRRIERLATTA